MHPHFPHHHSNPHRIPSSHGTPAGAQGVIDTNDDASARKAHAIRRGYWHDEYLLHFLACGMLNYSPATVQQNSPLMNRGFFFRVNFFDTAVRAFLEQAAVGGNRTVQIINVGCGFDTAWLRLWHTERAAVAKRELGTLSEQEARSHQHDSDSHNAATRPNLFEHPNIVSWVDLDYPDVVERKRRALDTLPSNLAAPSSIMERYHLVGLDLNDSQGVHDWLETQCTLGTGGSRHAVLERDRPTLLIFECVLVYFTPEKSQALLSALTKTLSRCAIVGYDPIRGDDLFGQRMVESVRQRGCPFLAFPQYNTCEQITQRFAGDLGMPHAACITMKTYSAQLLRRNVELHRWLQRLEMLDELEEWCLIMDHYCLFVASTLPKELYPWVVEVLN
eukprot:PhM_4_TR11916/c0_g1_i1/m.80121/K18203/LCMT1; [phosphatase 2A protein]-leucine-carboxy methyltransferase